MNGCGTCTACCQFLAIEGIPGLEAVKPAGEPCPHLCAKGCGIYETRPKPCVEFLCIFRQYETQLPEQARPDRLGVFMYAIDPTRFVCLELVPGAVLRPGFKALATTFLGAGATLVLSGTRWNGHGVLLEPGKRPREVEIDWQHPYSDEREGKR